MIYSKTHCATRELTIWQHSIESLPHLAAANPGSTVIVIIQVTHNNPFWCGSMHKFIFLQINANVVNIRFRPACAKKHQITFLKLSSADFFAVFMHHIGRIPFKGFMINGFINAVYQKRTVCSFTGFTPIYMRNVVPRCRFFVKCQVIFPFFNQS